MSNKKNKSKKTSGNQSRGSTGGFADAFKTAGIEYTPNKTVDEEDNKYKNYNPDRPGKKKSKHSGDSKKKSNNNTVHYLPPAEGPHAPYNFVPFSEMGKISAPQIGKYSEISEEKYTGEIRYQFTAKTPILVDNGSDQFCRNKDGKCIIPGSTMRGLVRSNLQILSFSDVSDDIDDYNLMYRAVAGGCLRKRYGDILGQKTKMINGHQMTVLENVKAGYISREGNTYYLYSNKGDSDGSFKNGDADYYVVSERYVFENASDNFQYIIKNFQTKPPFKKEINKGHVQYTSDKNKNYQPYKCQVSYNVSNGRVIKVDKEGVCNKSGYVLSSGFMEQKKAFYVIPEIDPDTKRKIPGESVAAYQIDCNRKRNTIPEKARSFYDLPSDGETRPVFYIELDGKLYFGYTPRLRLMYDHTISDGLKKPEKGSKGQDFAKTMFGFSTDKVAAKSKVFFMDAVLMGNERPADAKSLVLSEPKPTSYLEYLKQTEGKEVITYNSQNMELRGIKQYWLHEQVTDGAHSDKINVKSSIHPLEEGSCFAGRVRFQNLNKEELGLLLWSIMLEKDSQMNVGKAKPYGYGRIKVEGVDLYLFDQKSAYAASTEAFAKNPYEKMTEENITGFIRAYKNYATKKLGRDIMQVSSIRDFFAMKSEANIMKGPVVEYMSLKEYSTFKQNNNPLPVVQEICKHK